MSIIGLSPGGERDFRMEINKFVYTGVVMAAKKLTDEELNALCMVVMSGTDPRHVIGYEKVKYLFTEQDGTKMHHDARISFESYAAVRLGLNGKLAREGWS